MEGEAKNGGNMGIFGFLSKLFGLDLSEEERSQIRKEVRSEINLVEAISAHTVWKARLQKALDGKSDEVLVPAHICEDNRCVLGKWIHGTGGRRFGNEPTFTALRSEHALFHVHAANVVELTQAGNPVAAKKVFDNEYTQASHEVVSILMVLNKEFGEPSQYVTKQ